MIVLLSCIIVAFIIGIVICKVNQYDCKEDGDEITGTMVLSLFLGTVIGFMSILLGQSYLLSPTAQETSRTEIYSIGNEVGIDGHFVLGSGSIKSEMYYFYYIQGEYGYKIEKTDTSDVEIAEMEDEEQIGYIVVYKYLLEEENWWIAFGKDTLISTTKEVIYVPKGTIKISYNISLEGEE